MGKNNQNTIKKNKSNFVIQGSILAMAGIVVRLIGMLYRIPLARKIGNEGLGYYTAAYSVYSMLLIVSSYSLPVAVSKLISARMAQKQYKDSVRILKASLFYATVAGGIGAAFLWFGADYFAQKINMPYSAYALRTLAPTIWGMAYLGVLRGYFQGLGTMIPTALSQIFEQIVNAIISIVAATALFNYGLTANTLYESTEYAYAFGAAGGTIGTGSGAFVALIFLLFVIMAYLPVIKKQIKRDVTSMNMGYPKISYLLAITVMPIIISSAIYNVSSVLDIWIYGDVMAKMGRSTEIAATMGVYNGKYHMLFNIPVAIANALSSSLIPSLSRAVAEKNKGQVLDRITTAIRFSMLIAIPAAVGLTVLAAPISNLLFSGDDNAQLIQMMIVGSVAVVVFSLSTVTNAVLQGINHMKTPTRNAAIALVLHAIVLYILLYVGKMGIYSVVYANILFALLVCILNGLSIGYYLNYKQELKKTFLLPTIAAGMMGAAAYGSYQLTYKVILVGMSAEGSNMISTLVAMFVAIVMYGVLLLKLRCVDEVELYGMPAGAKIVRIGRKLHLL